MFKVLKYSALIFIMLLSVAQMSFAIPYTWVDSVTNGQAFSNGQKHYEFTYDITGGRSIDNVLTPDPDNPFIPGSDSISAAELLLNFHYGQGNDDSTMKIQLDGNDYLADVVITSINGQHQVLLGTVLSTLNNDGTVLLDINWLSGSFMLTSSTLTANGNDYIPTQLDPTPDPTPGGNNDPIPAPEPSTFLLLGAGLAGVGLVRKGIKK